MEGLILEYLVCKVLSDICSIHCSNEYINSSTSSLQLARRYTGGHKGAISCLMNFMAASGEVLVMLPMDT